MPYSSFKSVGDVSQKFDIEVRAESFIQTKEIQVLEYIFSRIEYKLREDAYFVNEYAICEHIISQILDAVSEKHKQLLVWSHVPFNVDQKQSLVSEPDYLIAPKIKYGVIVFTKDPEQISATENLQKVLEVLNWLFSQADTCKHN
ncbi:MAG: hypothetical protein D3905_04805 [Candidatus Electrothrix sp. AS4_5]|nr:hypothetical protein [Candidatus Electrothrix gigas]